VTPFVSEPLATDHVLDNFRCGVEPLDHWLVTFARHAEVMRTARTFVWHQDHARVVAYYSLAAHVVMRVDLPGRVGRGSPDVIPSILLARLALDVSLHGDGLGGELLLDALRRVVAVSEIAGARLVVVDAINDRAVSFYQHHGFVATPDNPARLVQKVSDIANAVT
jgi:GNAT superfamily N-acetyltransferase